MERLTIEDIHNPLFDKQTIVQRKVDGKSAFEWTTFTDNFVEIGLTYFLQNGLLSIKNRQNQQLFWGKVTNYGEFDKAVKKADKKHHQLEGLTKIRKETKRC